MEPIDNDPPRKRQKSNHDSKEEHKSILRDCLEEAHQLDKRLSPYLQTTVRKWSSKINSTTAFNSKKFDSSSKQQNAMDQLEAIWSSKSEKDKLISRSRTIKQRPSSSMNKPACPLIFEDRNFYLSLLKDVVESATRNQDLTQETMISENDYRLKRVHRENVDPKASKGRKIRYDIHDKLVSIMVPIQNELWTDNQKDELFASLFGFGYSDDHNQDDENQFLLSKSDGFKLF